MHVVNMSPALSSKMRNMSLLCAFLVVTIHCRPKFSTWTTAWWVKQLVEGGITRIAVPYFFLASGFLAAVKYDDDGYGKFVLKRFRTLVVPFVIWTVLFWLFCFAVSSLMDGRVNARMVSFVQNHPWLFLRQLGFWPIKLPVLTPLWYVRALFFLTLSFPVLRCCVRRLGAPWLTFLFLLYGFRLTKMPSQWLGLLQAFADFGLLPVEGLFYYSLGIWLYDRPRKSFGGNRAIMLSSLLLGLAMAGLRPVVMAHGLRIVGGIIRYTMVPFMLYGVWGMMPDKRLPAWLVSCSFGIFVIHKFVLYLINLEFSAGAGLPHYFAMAVTAFAISLGITAVMHKWLRPVANIVFGGR